VFATCAGAEIALTWDSTAGLVAVWALSAATAAAVARPLAEPRLWLAGLAWSALAAIVCVSAVTVPWERLWTASAKPGTHLWALVACIASFAWIGWWGPDRDGPRVQVVLVAVALALYGLSLGVSEIAERVSTASIQTDFERGQTAVSALWGALALGVFVVGLFRRAPMVERVGLAIFGLALVKLFLYDLQNLNSITRALSFLAVGAVLLTAAVFAERIVRHRGPDGRDGPRVA
jgi:hypothetical protein